LKGGGADAGGGGPPSSAQPVTELRTQMATGGLLTEVCTPRLWARLGTHKKSLWVVADRSVLFPGTFLTNRSRDNPDVPDTFLTAQKSVNLDFEQGVRDGFKGDVSDRSAS
jgi:hypothetical protein